MRCGAHGGEHLGLAPQAVRLELRDGLCRITDYMAVRRQDEFDVFLLAGQRQAVQ